jgi:hypothetical protein
VHDQDEAGCSRTGQEIAKIGKQVESRQTLLAGKIDGVF